MIITYFGKEFFKITQGDLTLGFNPMEKPPTRFGADVAFTTTNHPDFNGVENLSYGDKIPFIIDGPGDYEIKDVFIKGAISSVEISGKEYINTIYSFSLDDINIVFLGVLSSAEISKEAGESIEEPDLLFVPAGEIVGAKNAAKLASSLNPKIIIPMNHTETSLKVFLREMSADKPEKVDKLTLKKKDLEDKDGTVVVLKIS